MSEQEKIQYENNLKLVDLSLTLQDQDEIDYVRAQFETKPEKDFDAFKKKCDELYFHKILNSIDSWYGTFFMKSRLADLLEF
jgi:hypothetical protein